MWDEINKGDIQTLHFNNRIRKPFIARVNDIIEQYNIRFEMLAKESLPRSPPWKITNVDICTELYAMQKSQYVQEELRQAWNDHAREHQYLPVFYTDGSKSANGTGYSVWQHNLITAEKIPNECSIQTAELKAIQAAVEAGSRNNAINNIIIATDSRSSIQGITKYNNNSPLVIKILEKMKESNKIFTLCWVPSHTGVRGNEEADRAAVSVATHGATVNCAIPRSDYKSYIKQVVRSKWKEEWRNVGNNKLRTIKENVEPFKTSYNRNRQWERKLTRLRIGHTRITHEYLMSGENQKYCMDCIVPLTVQHIIIECPSFDESRRRHLGRPQNLKEVLGDAGPVEAGGALYLFLWEIQLFNRI